MSYYDDDDDDYDYKYDDDDDQYSSEDEIYYHNYSVDYAKQILGGHHAISSCLPIRRRRHRRYSPRLVRVATLDQIPIVHRNATIPSLHSRPKFVIQQNIPSTAPLLPPRLPSIEDTTQELERRATQPIQPISQTIINNPTSLDDNNPSNPTINRPMTEAELRQVQQQQEAFQQHLMNMQRHLLQQQQQQPSEEDVPQSYSSTSGRAERRGKVTYHDVQRDDDQAEIARLIETDPYFAAAMEDFADKHGLIHTHRQRRDSKCSTSDHSAYLCKRHRTKDGHGHSHRLTSSSSSSSSTSSLTNVTSELRTSKSDVILFRELHGIRRLIEEYLRNRTNITNPIQPTISVLPVPWPMPPTQYPSTMPTSMAAPSTGVHYPPVEPVTDYEPARVPRQRPGPTEANRAIYQNVVNTVRDVLDRRSPSQREQPLKPSQIDSKLKHVYTKPPRIPSTNIRPISMQRPPLPTNHQQTRRTSRQISTPPIVQPPPPPPPPPFPSSLALNNRSRRSSYEPLSNFSTGRSTLNRNGNLSYGTHQKNLNIYDKLVRGYYF